MREAGRGGGCAVPTSATRVAGCIERTLPHTPSVARRAREAVRPLAARALSAERQADVLLLVTELVTNSLLHATPGTITLRARLALAHLRVEVWDPGPGLRVTGVRMPAPEADGGRGLALVDRLSDRWGTERAPGGAGVWFEVGAG